jgi:hypothetical protein
MDEFRQFVEEVKEKADLLQVIQESGEYVFETAKRGKWIYCKHPNSLAVDIDWQQYTWFSKPGGAGHDFETGDVFDWLKHYRSMDFWDAAVYLAQKYGVRVPELKHSEPSEAAKSYQARGEAYVLVHQWLVKQLWRSPEALDYCRRTDGGRAWADETICHKVTAQEALAGSVPLGTDMGDARLSLQDASRTLARPTGSPYQFTAATMERARAVAAHSGPSVETAVSTIVARGAGLGFSPGTAEATTELRGWLEMNGADLKAPATVAIIGLQGDVAAWCREHAIQAQSNWLEKSRIYGLVEFPRLIYTHFGRGGKPVYFTARNLRWVDGKGQTHGSAPTLIGEPDKSRKSWNPPEQLVGKRMPYFNWLFHKNADEVVIVEGQADAITLGEWGIPAIGLNGLAAGPEVAAIVREIRKRFLALDQDAAGQAAMMKVAEAFGPKVRIVQWAVPLQFSEVEDAEA